MSQGDPLPFTGKVTQRWNAETIRDETNNMAVKTLRVFVKNSVPTPRGGGSGHIAKVKSIYRTLEDRPEVEIRLLGNFATVLDFVKAGDEIRLDFAEWKFRNAPQEQHQLNDNYAIMDPTAANPEARVQVVRQDYEGFPASVKAEDAATSDPTAIVLRLPKWTQQCRPPAGVSGATSAGTAPGGGGRGAGGGARAAKARKYYYQQLAQLNERAESNLYGVVWENSNKPQRPSSGNVAFYNVLLVDESTGIPTAQPQPEKPIHSLQLTCDTPDQLPFLTAGDIVRVHRTRPLFKNVLGQRYMNLQFDNWKTSVRYWTGDAASTPTQANAGIVGSRQIKTTFEQDDETTIQQLKKWAHDHMENNAVYSSRYVKSLSDVLHNTTDKYFDVIARVYEVRFAPPLPRVMPNGVVEQPMTDAHGRHAFRLIVEDGTTTDRFHVSGVSEDTAAFLMSEPGALQPFDWIRLRNIFLMDEKLKDEAGQELHLLHANHERVTRLPLWCKDVQDRAINLGAAPDAAPRTAAAAAKGKAAPKARPAVPRAPAAAAAAAAAGGGVGAAAFKRKAGEGMLNGVGGGEAANDRERKRGRGEEVGMGVRRYRFTSSESNLQPTSITMVLQHHKDVSDFLLPEVSIAYAKDYINNPKEMVRVRYPLTTAARRSPRLGGPSVESGGEGPVVLKCGHSDVRYLWYMIVRVKDPSGTELVVVILDDDGTMLGIRPSDLSEPADEARLKELLVGLQGPGKRDPRHWLHKLSVASYVPERNKAIAAEIAEENYMERSYKVRCYRVRPTSNRVEDVTS
ncbi:unnamed protein product [Vitrella brassicaformis CCMP3155]|uniref:Telomeric single stranded DNA binding POT1/Cdc13 domain-containing protein n=2 Tax=Vitrella brassicaformis TaxID=1169539 RepID=A0A0G4EWC2_VITBC|nr:unnamed protein product [Vitrella brassicaformis CCMP3155]|eukprot:CEM02338.1 unnamed protein product [Vitrella brassicaformis CCMP3155]